MGIKRVIFRGFVTSSFFSRFFFIGFSSKEIAKTDEAHMRLARTSTVELVTKKFKQQVEALSTLYIVMIM